MVELHTLKLKIYIETESIFSQKCIFVHSTSVSKLESGSCIRSTREKGLGHI